MNVMSHRTARIPEQHRVEIIWGVPRDPACPADGQLSKWVTGVLRRLSIPACEVSVRLMSAAEIGDLNRRYRDKSAPTNVLSFPYDEDVAAKVRVLGDIAVCTEVIEAEAKSQGKALAAHLAHMLVHGTLHLVGFDHIQEDEAQEMEQIEVEIMADFGFPDPYEHGSGSEGEAQT
jgi:probable rRNA maturation factor